MWTLFLVFIVSLFVLGVIIAATKLKSEKADCALVTLVVDFGCITGFVFLIAKLNP
jgi:hypothetical protein